MSLPDPLSHQILHDLTDHALVQCLMVIKRTHDLIPEELETSFIASIATSLIATLADAIPLPPQRAHLLRERHAAVFAGYIFSALQEQADRAEQDAAKPSPQKSRPPKRKEP